MPVEPLHRLDIVLDTKRPMWSQIQDIAALYRSAIIYSNGKYKIITDRADLPVRQVFHAANIVREKTEIRVGADPTQINQITGRFANKDADYEQDILIIQDSQSVLINNDPIRPTDLDLTGIVRKNEIARRLSIEMQQRRAVGREVSFTTGLEGIVVEPGDVCIAGILTTDFEMGYGGRALDGSISHLVADKEVTLNSGTTYDLWVWHVNADTPELRTVVGSAKQVSLFPTSNFDYTVQVEDRFAIGVQSLDLVKLLVKKITHAPDGLTQIVGDQFNPIQFQLDCPGSLNLPGLNDPPLHPYSVTVVQSGCIACFQLHYDVNCVGGSITAPIPGPNDLVYNQLYISNSYDTLPVGGSSLQSVVMANNTITFISGVNSGVSRRILDWPYWLISNTPQAQLFVTALPQPAEAGDNFYISVNTGERFGGFQLLTYTTTNITPGNEIHFAATLFNTNGLTTGNSACFDLSDQGDRVIALIQPVSSDGVVKTVGGWRFDLSQPGCFDPSAPIITAPNSISTQSLTVFFAMTLPESALSVTDYQEVRAIGLVTEVCSPTESTKASFSLTYASSTIIDSLVIDLRNAASTIDIGSNAPFTLFGQLRVYSQPNTHVRATLRYVGYGQNATWVDTTLASGIVDSLNFTMPQTFAFNVDVEHLDTGTAIHSHGCHAIYLDHGEYELIEL